MTTNNKSEAENPYEGLEPLFGIAFDALARTEGANVPLELAVHDLRWTGDWRLSLCRAFADVEGISVVTGGGHWFLEAQTPLAAAALANMAVVQGRRPTTITTTEKGRDLVWPLLQEGQAIESEGTARLLRSQSVLPEREGRWATMSDLSLLQNYADELTRAGVNLNTSWDSHIAGKELAIAVMNNAVIASVRRHGPAPRFAGIADLHVLPEFRPTKVATGLVGFVVSELLATRQTVYVLVDESDSETLRFYEALGFADAGTYYKANFKSY